VDLEDPVVVGEMAHVISRKPKGPRGDGVGGDDSYENLILLCPNHHTLVDKAEGRYPEEMLRQWKRDHETAISEAFASPLFESLHELAKYILPLLAENKGLWAAFGPDSNAAQSNPLTSVTRLWTAHKFATIIPNNRRILEAVKKHRHLLAGSDLSNVVDFITHAEGFEAGSYERTEGIPRFPPNFEEMISAWAE
jgi:hypothetical protein